MVIQPVTAPSNKAAHTSLSETPFNDALLDVFGPKGNAIRNHFQHILSMSNTKRIAVFIAYILLSEIAICIILEALPFYSFGDNIAWKNMSASTMLTRDGFLSTFFMVVMIAPFIETLMMQWFPIWLTRKFTPKPIFAVWFSTLLLGACHLHAGLYGFCMAATIGFYLAVAFIHGRQFSKPKAFWTTSIIHASINAIGISLALITST